MSMEYGTRSLNFTPIVSEPAGSLPQYGETVNLGGLNKVGVNPVFIEAKAAGDDMTKAHVIKFKEVQLPTTVTSLPKAAAAVVFGSTLTEDGDLISSRDDAAPYGALDFITPNLDEDTGKETYTARFYPKAKAMRQGVEFNTFGGDSISLVHRNLQVTGVVCYDGHWEHESKDFDTQAEAEAWIKTKLTGAAG